MHPLVWWQRYIVGIRRLDFGAATGRSAGPRAVGELGKLTLHTTKGPTQGVVMCVPELPEVLLADQQRALALEQKAVAMAELKGVRVVGLGNALGVVAQRGNGLAERVKTPVTNGQAATAWTATEVTMEVLRRRGRSREPVGVLGTKSAVGDAISYRLVANGVPVVVAEQGRSASRAAAHGCEVTDQKEMLARCRVLVGASTTGPVLEPRQVQDESVLIDLALPPTLSRGRKPSGLNIVPGEVLSLDGGFSSNGWGAIWKLIAGYGQGTVLACFAEPAAMSLLDLPPTIGGRWLAPESVSAMGAAMTSLGFHPVVKRLDLG